MRSPFHLSPRLRRPILGSAVLSVWLGLPVPSAIAQVNRLANASFEQPRVPITRYSFTLAPPAMPGWRITAGAVGVVPYSTWAPAEGQGRQSLIVGDAVSTTSIEQDVPTQPGQYYLFSGWLAHDPDSEDEGQAQLFVDGQLLARLDHKDPNATLAVMQWKLFAYRFRAAGAMTTVKITGGGAVLDGLAVALTGAPSPVGSFFPIDLSGQINERLFDPLLNGPGRDLTDLGDRLTPENPLMVLEGIPFLLDGVILVGPGSTQGTLTQGPVSVVRKVAGVPVGRKVARLHFLHATNFSPTQTGGKIGAYVIHYADGSTVSIPLRYGVDLANWWTQPGAMATGATVAWRGRSEASTRLDRLTGFRAQYGRPLGLQLFRMTWENPSPDRVIRSIDMVTGDQASGPGAEAPFLVAVTGE